jgi:hypothetical protein
MHLQEFKKDEQVQTVKHVIHEYDIKKKGNYTNQLNLWSNIMEITNKN